ncbi:DUF2092 domain-containing protein [Dokdonella sp.]|uniref:DUF2092 domain-containing protein n=1 Tax=Dokdonella sp. TaxID=2291710 RepID=UPI003528074C
MNNLERKAHRGLTRTGSALASLLMVVLSISSSVAAEPALDSEADALLKKMSNYMAGLKAFTVDVHNTSEIVDTQGQKLNFSANGEVSVMRPNMLKAHRTDSNGETFAYYDGKNVTVYAKSENFYAVAAAPGDFDQALDFLRDAIQIDLPGADLLYNDIYAGMTWNLTSSSYVGLESIGGKMAHHLAFRTPEVDFQIWIQDGDQPLPLRYLITSKWVTAAPQFGVSMSNWNLKPKLNAKMFEFKAPAGAQKVDFVTSLEVQP